MAQIQILPQIPTFGSRLASTLGQATGDIGGAFIERHKAKANQTHIEKLVKELNEGGKTPIQKLGVATQLINRLGPENAKAIMPFLASLISEEQPAPSPGTAPGTPTNYGVPQGATEAITAATQPNAAENLPIPAGQTDQEVEDKKKELLRKVGLPYGIGERAKQELQDIREEKKIAARERLAERQQGFKKELKEEANLDKLQDEIVGGYESALLSDANLNKMQALSDTGELISPLGAYLSNMFGVPVSLVSNADTEEFQKLIAQRGLNVASAYGFGRILATEFMTFLQTIPSLVNSKEGKDRIINTLRYFDNIAKARYSIYRNELKNKKPGESTRQIKLDIADKMEPMYEKFSEVLQYGDELIEMKDDKGNTGRVPKNQVDEALQNGYTLVG